MDNGQAREVKMEKKKESRIDHLFGVLQCGFSYAWSLRLSPNMEEFFVKVAGDKLYGKFGIEFGCSDGGMSHHYLQYFLRDSFP